MSGDISSPNSTFQGRKAAHTPVKLSTEFILNESLMLGSIIVSCMTLCLRCTKTNYGIKLLTWPVVWEMYLLWQHLSVKALTARINKDGRIILFRSLVKVQTRRKHTHTHAYTLPQRWRNTRTNSSPRRSRAGGWKMSLWREGESQRWKSLAVIAGLCFPGVCVCVFAACVFVYMSVCVLGSLSLIVSVQLVCGASEPNAAQGAEDRGGQIWRTEPKTEAAFTRDAIRRTLPSAASLLTLCTAHKTVLSGSTTLQIHLSHSFLVF